MEQGQSAEIGPWIGWLRSNPSPSAGTGMHGRDGLDGSAAGLCKHGLAPDAGRGVVMHRFRGQDALAAFVQGQIDPLAAGAVGGMDAERNLQGVARIVARTARAVAGLNAVNQVGNDDFPHAINADRPGVGVLDRQSRSADPAGHQAVQLEVQPVGGGADPSFGADGLEIPAGRAAVHAAHVAAQTVGKGQIGIALQVFVGGGGIRIVEFAEQPATLLSARKHMVSIRWLPLDESGQVP